ncbi:hypothetical protein LSTR_LSTR010470 [Laodelphax striatellus]|uniref:Uncharacterized protein n=1 Tax=Laodelphax striatellus TaxID=195883 RepID=A0A482X6D9_LAOST|nr:hypothetical protein LSTR_LSTR010470 [Laodelphax striatellus]
MQISRIIMSIMMIVALVMMMMTVGGKAVESAEMRIDIPSEPGSDDDDIESIEAARNEETTQIISDYLFDYDGEDGYKDKQEK